MLSRVFIDRPIFAWVLAIIALLAGVGASLGLAFVRDLEVAMSHR